MNESNSLSDERETCQLVGGYYDGDEVHVYPFTTTLLRGGDRPRFYLDGSEIDWSDATPDNPVKGADKMDWRTVGPRLTYVRDQETNSFVPKL
jgi:hypothetical protein